MRLTHQQLRETAELAARIDKAGRGAKRRIVTEAAASYGVSAHTIYRRLRCVRPSDRRTRNDLGTPRLDENSMREVLRLKEQTRTEDVRTGRERIVPTDIAREQAMLRGISVQASTSTINRYARRNKLDSAAPKQLWRPKRAARPNDMHQIDASGSKLFRWLGVNERGEDMIGIRPRTGYRRNRAKEPVGVWVVGVTDDCSGATWSQYAIGGGESFEMVLDFLRTPWGGDPRCPIRGLPDVLNTDKGPFLNSQRAPRLLDALGVRVLPRMPNSPQITGKRERGWRTMWGRFELTYQWTPERVLTLSELNEEHAVFLARENVRPHQWEIEHQRIDIYQAGLAGRAVRLMPEGIERAVWDERMRKVSASSSFRCGNEHWRVDDAVAGQWIEVLHNAAGDIIARDPATGITYDVELVAPTDWAEYDPRHYTPRQRLAQEAGMGARPGGGVPQYAEDAADGAEAIVLRHTPNIEPAAAETPFTEHERARTFANIEEGVDCAVKVMGTEPFIGEPGLIGAVRDLIVELRLDRALCMEGFLKLRDMA